MPAAAPYSRTILPSMTFPTPSDKVQEHARCFGAEAARDRNGRIGRERMESSQEYRFPVTVHRLRPGFNVFDFAAPDDAGTGDSSSR